MKKQVNTDDLEIGMYVYELDRPWLDTPFLFQGFTINTAEDIKKIKECCKFVYIIEDQRLQAPEPSHPAEIGAIKSSTVKGLPEKPVQYENKSSVEKELGIAKQTYHSLTKEIYGLVQNIRLGEKISAKQLSSAADQMVDSIIRNPDAFFWLSKLKKINTYAYNHAIDSSALAVAFGRHLGFSKDELSDISIGVLLCDIGNTKLDKKLLSKPGRLTQGEKEQVKQHVAYSVEIMRTSKGINDVSIGIAHSHHERFNGSGYPQGLVGNDIPIGGRIAAIVDYYDAITSDRAYNPGLPPHLAIRKLYERRNIDFQEELVEQFIQTLGVYPTGSLVELNTGEVGIVLSQNRTRALRPKIMLILDKDKVAYGIFPTIDLITDPKDENGNIVEISKAVEAHTYGIDPKDYYL